MQIVEAKNNLVKISYETSQDNLILSGFVVIKDANQSFVGQIIHLEATYQGNFAIIKLLFTFDDQGMISNYNGSIPDVKCIMDTVHPQELLELLPVQNPIFIGEVAQQNVALSLDRALFEENLLICSEKEDDNEMLVESFVSQLSQGGKKVLLIDLEGNLSKRLGETQNTVVASKDFKLPLNYETINFIYEKGLEDAKAETKALIQEIFLEVQEYVKTLADKFIPFESFRSVVDDQYQESGFVELVLLKNKLLKYYEAGVFAQEKDEFNTLKFSLKNKEATILDLSLVEPEIQREMVSYVYSLIDEINNGKEIYSIVNLNNLNADKKLLKQIFKTKQVYSTIICSYSFKYLKELKQLSKNLILFAPIQQQDDFAGYGTFLGKLNPHECIVYGHSTHYLPFIVKADTNVHPVVQEASAPAEEIEAPQEKGFSQEFEEEFPGELNYPTTSEEELLDEEIRRDVDEIFIAPKNVYPDESQTEDVLEEYIQEEIHDDVLTDDDLDFIDDLNIVQGAPSGIQEENQEENQNEMSGEAHGESPEGQEGAQDFEYDEYIDITEDEMQEVPENIYQETQEVPQEPAIITPVTSSIEQPIAPAVDILPMEMASTPMVPVYTADIEPKVQSDDIVQGDNVIHPKYGKGTVEKLISYGNKTLCSIHFDNVGRRLLDPTLAEIKKVDN